jgi:hypothetical protein
MPKLKEILVGILVLLCPFSDLWSNHAFSGYFLVDSRLTPRTLMWHFYESRLSLLGEYNWDQKAHGFLELWIRAQERPRIISSNDLVNVTKLLPGSVELREGYLRVHNFLIKDLDMRIGSQRISWGVADRLSPTDNINPNDLEDIWDFGRHLPSYALNLIYYHKGFSLQSIWVPFFKPALLPQNTNLFFPTISLPLGFHYRYTTDTIIMPEAKLKEESRWALKLKGNLFNYDFSVSYLYGRYDLPLPTKISFIPTEVSGEVLLKMEYAFPRTHIWGWDLAGTIKDLGIWLEGAIYLPEKVNLINDLSRLGMGCDTKTILEKSPYVRYLLGFDYTLKNGLYINFQYLHGFLSEFGKERLNDYFTVGLEYQCLENKLKIIPVNCMIEIDDFKNFKDYYGLAIMPEISYWLHSELSITLGYRLIDARPLTMLGKFSAEDEIYLKVKYSF